jgi:translation initiation factor IF-2
MAHTVETLSKLLKKTPDEVITILATAGIDGKKPDSIISGEERKILMSSLTKRSSSKSSMSVSRRSVGKTASSKSDGVKVQVKKKRVKSTVVESEEQAVINETALAAQATLDAGRDADEKLLAQDAKRLEMVRLQQEKTGALKNQQEAAKQEQKIEKVADKTTKKVVEKVIKKVIKKTIEKPKDKKTSTDKKPKRMHKAAPSGNGRRQLHVARHNPNRRLK